MPNKKSAFTLIEVLIATTVLASSIYVLSSLHYRSVKKITGSAQEVERVFFVKKYLYELFIKPPHKTKPKKITLERPEIIITTGKLEINSRKSSLKQFAKEIDIIWSQGTWGEKSDLSSMKMISFVQKPPEKKS